MSESTGVTWTARALATLHDGGEFGRFLVLKPAPHSGSASLVELVQLSIATANDAAPVGATLGSFAVQIPQGVAFLTHDNTWSEVSGVPWLTAFAAALESAGVAGRIVPSPVFAREVDVLLRREDRMLLPTAFLGYRMQDYRPADMPFRGWQVDDATASTVAQNHLAWLGEITSGQTYATAIGSVPIAPEVGAEFLARTTAVSAGNKRVLRVDSAGRELRHVALGQMGQCVTRRVDLDASWQELLDDQVGRLRAHPEALDVAMIKNAQHVSFDWGATDVEWPDCEHRTALEPFDYERNRHLWDSYVIDAAGVQLLTGKHLSHAHDLSDWTVEEVAPDRYLVSARDLEPWYAALVAEPATIERARADFGDMILTWDTILANPGPYTIIRPQGAGR